MIVAHNRTPEHTGTTRAERFVIYFHDKIPETIKTIWLEGPQTPPRQPRNERGNIRKKRKVAIALKTLTSKLMFGRGGEVLFCPK